MGESSLNRTQSHAQGIAGTGGGTVAQPILPMQSSVTPLHGVGLESGLGASAICDMPGISAQSIPAMATWSAGAAASTVAIIGIARAVVWPTKPTRASAATTMRIRFHMRR